VITRARAKRSTLTSHYRNGLKICRVADGIKNLIDHPHGLEATSNYDEAKFPSSVDVFPGLNLEEQVAKAIPRIQTQLLAYPGEMIGVLCPRIEDLDAVRDQLAVSSLSAEIHVQQDRLVVLSTTMGAKGLQFRAVHILAADNLKRFPTQRNLTYTAVTRTKTRFQSTTMRILPATLRRGLALASL
jgi:DNA helicase IV